MQSFFGIRRCTQLGYRVELKGSIAESHSGGGVRLSRRGLDVDVSQSLETGFWMGWRSEGGQPSDVDILRSHPNGDATRVLFRGRLAERYES